MSKSTVSISDIIQSFPSDAVARPNLERLIASNLKALSASITDYLVILSYEQPDEQSILDFALSSIFTKPISSFVSEAEAMNVTKAAQELAHSGADLIFVLLENKHKQRFLTLYYRLPRFPQDWLCAHFYETCPNQKQEDLFAGKILTFGSRFRNFANEYHYTKRILDIVARFPDCSDWQLSECRAPSLCTSGDSVITFTNHYLKKPKRLLCNINAIERVYGFLTEARIKESILELKKSIFDRFSIGKIIFENHRIKVCYPYSTQIVCTGYTFESLKKVYDTLHVHLNSEESFLSEENRANAKTALQEFKEYHPEIN